MLRKDVVDAVRAGQFQVWAVATIEEGLEVLTGQPAGSRGEGGLYPDGSVLGRVGARLTELAESLPRFGPADAPAD
jgi:hypothetical protein